jgi:hypothetical protein
VQRSRRIATSCSHDRLADKSDLVGSLCLARRSGRRGTTGRFVSTIVEGTRRLTQDECNQSKVSVVVGKVKVLDLLRNKTKTLTAGRHYIAKRRG